MERRFNPAAQVAIETREDGKPPLIVGYGAVFYDGTPATQYQLWSDTVERIMPGAFDQALREDDVRMLFNHDANLVLGRTSSKTGGLSVDLKGLRYWAVQPETQAGRDVVTSINRKDVTGSSFSFLVRPGGQVWREEPIGNDRVLYIRELISVQLFDTGPVTFPAYEGTSTGVRDKSDVDEAQRAFAQWKESRKLSIAPGLGGRLAAYHVRALEVSD